MRIIEDSNPYLTLLNKQKDYFNSGKSLPVSYRLESLKKLKQGIQKHEPKIIEALASDFNKPPFESYASEIGFVYEEISHAVKNLKKWAKPRKVKSGLLNFPSSSYIIPQPKGVTLIIGPWNYPFMLAIAPLIAAISAGNTAVVKPPEQAPAVSQIIEDLLKETFPQEYVAVLQGEGHEVVPQLMNNYKFDHVFFTGSTAVGKKIAEMAAPNLTPCTLELGGKSPTIVDETANLKVAARRIAFGKWINAGQTCVAPDYLLVHQSVKDDLVKELTKTIKEFYGSNPLESEDYASLINKNHFDNQLKLLKGQNQTIGGSYDETHLRLAPTLVIDPLMDDALMQQEVFGPVLPIISYQTKEEALTIIQKNPNPLAFYIFSANKKTQDYFVKNLSFGGGMVNNTLVHLTNPNLPFGGVGTSGYGNYHGKFGFDTFSHQKAVMKTGTWFDLKQKYPPYSSFIEKVVRRFMR